MFIVNLLVAIFCARVSYAAFKVGLDTHGWFCLILSAVNTAYFLDAVI